MSKKIFKFSYLVLLLSFVLIAIDQIIKLVAIHYLHPTGSYPLWEGVLHFTYVENTGAAFGMFANLPFILRYFMLLGLPLIVVLVIIGIILSNKISSKFLVASLGLVVAGGAGNLIDRFFRGFVVDYIHVKIINFAVFNFADCCVVIGTGLLLIYFIFLDKEILHNDKPKEEKIEKDEDE